MKKSLIPILSLAFIISLDSCKKDSDNHTEDNTRVEKLVNHSTNSNGDFDHDATFFEYDNSGRIISYKDSADPTRSFTISYVGDEAIFQDVTFNQGSSVYSARYKLNSDHLPIQRITSDGTNSMTATYSVYSVYTDTCKFEYDAAGLLVKASGTGFDTSWIKRSTETNFSSNRKVYTINYTNSDGKLTAVKINRGEVYSRTVTGSNGYTNSYAKKIEDNFSYEYTKNYANKVDKINAWVFIEMEALYDKNAPMIKYAYFPDKMNHSQKTFDAVTGNLTSSSTDDPQTRELEYSPSGYISSVSYIGRDGFDKYMFTYNK